MPPGKREALRRDLLRLMNAEEEQRPSLALKFLGDDPEARAAVGPAFASLLEGAFGQETDAALGSKELHVDAETRRLLNFEMLKYLGAAERGLEAMQAGHFTETPPELSSAPVFASPPAKQRQPKHLASENSMVSLEELLDHKARIKTLPAKTVESYRHHLREFSKFVGHANPWRITSDEVRRWRDHLISTDLATSTINGKYLAALHSVLAHGVTEFGLERNAATGIRDHRKPGGERSAKGYSEEQALAILRATFRGSSKALSEPHRRAIFWVPWILAYTGLRVSEVTQLRVRDLVEVDDIPHLLITPESGRTKGGNAWATGIHKHLIEMGIIPFIKSIGSGPIFHAPYLDSLEGAKNRGRTRAEEAGRRVASWVSDEVGIDAPLGHPNHAWRHLFTTTSRKVGMDKEARDFMLGSRSRTDAREDYGEWTPDVLYREINKLPRYSVEDTGERPYQK